MEEEISRLRELELAAIQDVKHVNNLTTLHKVGPRAWKLGIGEWRRSPTTPMTRSLTHDNWLL